MNELFNKDRNPGGEYGRSEYLYRYIIIAVSFLLICAVYTGSAFKIRAAYYSNTEVEGEEY